MKCPMCDGKGIRCEESDNGIGYISCECYHCNGTGEIEQTEQEYIQTCNTEQLAEWLRGVYWHCHEIDCKHCNYPWRCMEKGDIVEWLKQPHTVKE